MAGANSDGKNALKWGWLTNLKSFFLGIPSTQATYLEPILTATVACFLLDIVGSLSV